MRLTGTPLERQVGSSVIYVAPDPIGIAGLRYYREAFASLDFEHSGGIDPDPLVTLVPPTLIFETNQYTQRRPDSNGYSGHTWEGTPEGAVWIRGGNEYRFGRAVRPEDRLRVKWTLVAASDITTTNGREMIRLVSEADVSTVDGDWLGWTRETMFLTDRILHDG